jgi:hypothetical protein
VYKRDILSYIGMYDESLKVLGDWDFLIRLMYFTQIKVLKKPLANYHIRVNPSGIYGNSINTEGWSNLHIEYESYVRHKYQYTKVLLPNFEKKDVGSDIVNAKASKTYWHWDYVREVKSILNIKPDYIENMKSIVDKIGEEFNSDSPLKVYLYGAGKLFEELIEDRRFIDLINYLEVRGMVDSKFDNGNSREEERAFSTEALREKDIDVIIVTLENPEQVLGILKSKVGPNVKIYCIASSY